MAAKFSQRKGAAAAQVRRTIQPACDQQITPATRALYRAEFKRLPRLYGYHLAHDERCLIKRGVDVCAGQRDGTRLIEAQRRAAQSDFQSGGLTRVLQQLVTQPSCICGSVSK